MSQLAGSTHERRIDVLRCGQGNTHDVAMEWETVGGIRTGRTIAYCYDCRAVVPACPPPAPATWSWQRKPAYRRNNSGASRRRTKPR
jgi:hypothetical protein